MILAVIAEPAPDAWDLLIILGVFATVFALVCLADVVIAAWRRRGGRDRPTPSDPNGA